jgi:DNA repair exonuclease SbcCD ATPase subunit
MRLTHVTLHPFGRFSHESRHFGGPLVVVHGPNELGKTTVRQAIFHALFTPTNLAPAQFRDTMERWLPQPAGDHAIVTLAFEHDGVAWTLDKRWGAGASSRLTDGTTVLGDATAVHTRLGAMLAHNEATFRHVLFTGQAELEQTLAAIRHNAAALRDIRDLLRAGAGVAGDVDEQRLRQKLDDRITKAFSRWNDDRGRPESQNGQEKGLANPWKRGAGLVVETWYAWQRFVAERDAVLALERDIDEINTLVAEQDRIVSEAAAFLSRHGHLRNDLAQRSLLEERLSRLEGEVKTLAEAFRAWPVAEAATKAWSSRHTELETAWTTLQEELRAAQQRRDGTAARQAFRTIEAAKLASDQAAAVAESLPAPGHERLLAVTTLHTAITAIENKLASRTLAWRLESERPGHVLVTRGSTATETIAIDQEGTVGTAEARLRVVAGGITLTVDGGGGDVNALFQSLEVDRARLTRELEACHAKTRDDLVVMVEKRREADAIAKQKEAALAGALGGKTFAQWEEAIQALDSLPQARDLVTIESQMETVRAQRITEATEVQRHQSSIDGWGQAYGDQEGLEEKLLAAKAALREGRETLAALPMLPTEFASSQALLAQLDDAQRNRLEAQEQLTESRARCAELTTQLGDRRSQDVIEAAEAAARAFERARAEGRAYLRIKKVLDSVTAGAATDPLQVFGDKVASIFSRITGGTATLEFSGQVPARVVRGAVSLPPECLSHGSGGALALAVRLSMAEAYLADGGGFLMLDDPFVHFDPHRMAIATDILREVSAHAQVIVFTCHEHHASRLTDPCTLVPHVQP